MSFGEGDKADPGHYRKQSVRVGNLIPPPAPQVPELMADLERYINTDTSLPPLIQAGLAHVQFETIHPFLDGNGRISRLLIVLIMMKAGLLREPMIYPSYYFKKRHLEYYHMLDKVRTDGDFEAWIAFYLKAIKESCDDAYRRAQDIEALEQKCVGLLKKQKMNESRFKALHILFALPVVRIDELSTALAVSYNTANQILTEFTELGFLVRTAKQKRGKLYIFQPYFEILEREY